MLYFTSFLSLSIFAFPDSELREKVHKSSSFNTVCLVVQHRSYSRSRWRIVGVFELTDSLARVLSHLSPSARIFFRCHRSIHQFHISLLAGYSIFKVRGNFTFHIYPDIRKAKYSKKNKIFKKIFSLAKKTKK